MCIITDDGIDLKDLLLFLTIFPQCLFLILISSMAMASSAEGTERLQEAQKRRGEAMEERPEKERKINWDGKILKLYSQKIYLIPGEVAWASGPRPRSKNRGWGPKCPGPALAPPVAMYFHKKRRCLT